MRYTLLFLIFLTSLYAQKLINPVCAYKISSGLVTDILYKNKQLYAATDSGSVDIFNTDTKKKTLDIKLTKIKDFMGDEVNSKIFSLDMLNNTLLILSQDSGGYSRINFYKNSKLLNIISKENKLNIIKAKFINKTKILIALISNDIVSYNIKTKKIEWSTQASMSKFSSFALNNDRTLVAIADESGDVHILSTKDGKKVKTLSGENVDNIFSIDFKNDVILTGGQDRRAAVYNTNNNDKYYKSSNFFIYGVGLSPSGKIGAYSSDFKNNVTLFYTNSKENIAKYKSDGSVVNGIYFINEKEFFINSNSKTIGYYKVKN